MNPARVYCSLVSKFKLNISALNFASDLRMENHAEIIELDRRIHSSLLATLNTHLPVNALARFGWHISGSGTGIYFYAAQVSARYGMPNRKAPGKESGRQAVGYAEKKTKLLSPTYKSLLQPNNSAPTRSNLPTSPTRTDGALSLSTACLYTLTLASITLISSSRVKNTL